MTFASRVTLSTSAFPSVSNLYLFIEIRRYPMAQNEQELSYAVSVGLSEDSSRLQSSNFLRSRRRLTLAGGPRLSPATHLFPLPQCRVS